MKIRLLKETEYEKAIALKVSCFDEEVKHQVPYSSSEQEELDFMIDWMNSAEKYQDIRVLYGAFFEDAFVGFVGESIADESDAKSGIEINYLFVDEAYRGRGVSYKLLQAILSHFKKDRFNEVVVYNYVPSDSNKYYRYLGGEVIRTFPVFEGRIMVDLFRFDYGDFLTKIAKEH